MESSTYYDKMVLLEKIIRNKNTGIPAHIAHSLHVSERVLFRMLKKLKSVYPTLKYDKKNKTYVII